MGSQGLLLLIGLKLLIIMTSLQNIVILGAQGILMLMRSKFLIKMTRLQNIFLPEITIFCSEVMMIRSFNPIKSRRPWLPILISHLFQQGTFSSWPLLFLHLGCFCLDMYIRTYSIHTYLHTRVETGSGHPGHILPGSSGSNLLYKISRSDLDSSMDPLC